MPKSYTKLVGIHSVPTHTSMVHTDLPADVAPVLTSVHSVGTKLLRMNNRSVRAKIAPPHNVLQLSQQTRTLREGSVLLTNLQPIHPPTHLLNPQQLVVLGQALGPAGRAGLDLAGGQADGEVSDEAVLRLTRPAMARGTGNIRKQWLHF